MIVRKNFAVAAAFLAECMLVLASGTSYADDARQVWRDTEGEIVRDYSSGTCVRENSDADDACAPAPQQVVYTPPAKRTFIAKEDRTVYFEFNGADLTDESKLRLNSLADRIKSASDVSGANVAGYADRIGTISYNEMLSKARAKAVRDYLGTHGIVDANVTKTRWYGKSEPKANCASNSPRTEMIQCLQPDRKVQVDIVYRVQMPTQQGQ